MMTARGNDLLDSTFYQIFLLKKLGFAVPAYGHLPLLVDSSGVRLSKRQHGITVKELREAGVTAEEVIGKLLYWAGAVPKGTAVSAEKAVKNIGFSECSALRQPQIQIDTDF